MKIHVPTALKRRIESFQANDALVAAGGRLVHDDVVAVPGYPDTAVRLFDDWAVNPHQSRSWQWSVAAFRFMPSVIAHHARNDDAAALEWALQALRSWQKAIRGKLKRYEFARNDHAVAAQAENLVFLLAHLHMRGLREEAHQEVAAAIHGHADLLATEEFYSRHTNHGIEQARTLAVIADLFPDDPRSPARMALAIDRLVDELDFAFTREGVHVENSPGYHAYVCLSFLKIRDYFPQGEIAALADRIDALMPRAMRYLVHVSRPDGTLPVIGDTVEAPVPTYFRRYRATRDYAHLRYVATDGAEGVPPPHTTVLYPQAGYFIARDAWYPPGEGRRAFHLVFRCGYRSGYHRHDDDLSLVLYCEGEDWLIDSGAYSYAEQDPLRRYMRSKWAHNVPVVPGRPADRWDWVPPAAVLPMLRIPSTQGAGAVRGISHSYPGHVAMRDVQVDAVAREFTVVDSLIQSGKPRRRNYLSLWHVPADKSVRIEGQQVTLESKVTGRRLVIDNMGRRANEVRLLDPAIPGVDGPVVSRIAGRVEPAQLVAFEWSANHLHAMLRFRLLDGEGVDDGSQ
ncbi:heparinase II/III domain-containing protein [Luteimonas lutimaris]|uniref:Heparin-sulfate lyase N-terminal domain-containing protein n=1 Tax=Luteimonas lutimaris TaxID=698645 RepID=A0ABP7MWP4_9GAMM